MAQQNEKPQTKVITGKVRFSYLHVWQPEAIGDSDEKKYSVSLIISKDDKETIKRVEAAIKAAVAAGKDSKFGGKVPANIKMPLRDGDIDRAEDEAYKDAYFLNATCRTKPGVVDKNLNPIIDQDELYSGCFGRASVTFYAFNTNGNKGIACGLNNVQKLSDGEPLGGRSTAESDFGDGFKPILDDDDDLL
ncbi:Protein of unknown function DUF2815 [uncultured Caudovirales phage]|uniref:DUF2815 family protein n=1 Tax=uncultured Caudovirales phage TaxID=2100421 RepID=A0A6J5LTI3_9CAUD|nr:Protein of unknown function DUF2815 [uncultured Caudovirales phage]CAB4168733.1 Protein of unknown function DUF2815 [uncultured Caudovirales phage]